MTDETWIQRIPKTELTWAFAWLVAFAIVGRYLATGDAPDATLLGFSSVLIIAAAGLQVGMRATTKPEVIRAETEAKIVAATAEQVIPARVGELAVPDATIARLAPMPPEATERVSEEAIP